MVRFVASNKGSVGFKEDLHADNKESMIVIKHKDFMNFILEHAPFTVLRQTMVPCIDSTIPLIRKQYHTLRANARAKSTRHLLLSKLVRRG